MQAWFDSMSTFYHLNKVMEKIKDQENRLYMLLVLITAFFAGVLFVLIIVMGIGKCHIINDLEYANYKTLEYKESLCNAYYNYFNNAEAMLDSVKIEDSPYIETDKGSEYLNSVKAVKDLQDQEENCDKY